MKKFSGLLVVVLIFTLCIGMTIRAEETESVRLGQRYDFDGSRGRTIADATILLRHISGHEDGIIAEGAGDVSGDGRTSIYDAVCFLKILLNDQFDLEDCIKIATFNIKAAWYNQTLDSVAMMLIDTDADIVGLQEVDYASARSMKNADVADQVAYLAKKAGYRYYYFSPVIQLGNGTVPLPAGVTENTYGHAILSRYPITDYHLYYPETQGVDANGNPVEVRAIACHKIQIGDKTLGFYNGHLNGSVGRKQFQEVQNQFMAYDQYAVFTGDMNETYKELNGYLDEERFEFLTDNSHIDHIIVSNDTIGWYADENGNTSNTLAAYEDANGGNGKSSDHDLEYSYIYLKEY